MNRPGFRTSEFKIAAGNAIAQVILAWQGQVTDPQAVKYGVYGAIAYILARGFAKYENRNPPAG